VAVVAAAIWAASTLRPDVLIAGDGRGFAVRGNNGRLAIHHTGDNFAVREWLAADADGRDVHDQSLGQGIACDPLGCIGKLPGGGLVAYALSPEAFEDDCSCATLLIASRGDPPADCKATAIDHALWRQRGALVLRRRGKRFRHRVGAAEEFRPAVVAGSCAAPSACRRFRGIRPSRVRQSRSRCDPTSGGHRSGSVDRQRAARRRPLIPAKAGIQNWQLNFSNYWVPVYAGTSDRVRAFSTAGTGRRACPGCARGWAEGYEPHRPYWLARAQSRRRGGGSA
jgi:hypothetical protein